MDIVFAFGLNATGFDSCSLQLLGLLSTSIICKNWQFSCENLASDSSLTADNSFEKIGMVLPDKNLPISPYIICVFFVFWKRFVEQKVRKINEAIVWILEVFALSYTASSSLVSSCTGVWSFQMTVSIRVKCPNSFIISQKGRFFNHLSSSHYADTDFI